MARDPPVHMESVAQPTQTSKASIQAVPMEIILDIMELMSPRELCNFGQTNKHFFQIFTDKQAHILLKILRQCPELEILLFLYTANEMDFHPDRMLHPRTITFTFTSEGADENKIFLMRSPVGWKKGKLVCPEKIKLNVFDLMEISKLVKVVDWWVEVYPRLRWRDHPEERRCLKLDEEARLRKALARWWLYSHYFHGNYRRNTHAPKKFDEDVRLHHMRILTTQEIHELDDLWSTMYETISKDLCSSPGKVYRPTGSVVELIPWGKNGDRHPSIVNTYLKLGPDLIKYFLEHCYRYNKKYLIKTITNSTNMLLFDRETLSMSISTVLEERAILNPDHTNPLPRMGITNEDRASPGECEAWNNDSWPSGFPPITKDEILELPLELTKRVPRGDDGADRAGGY
ncbi:hypothetical protein F5Y19DRAFT_467693 [Xylariaceae sp. FL1651]|nr:hypothetical protein F5Y19DRAFT_467693 [Xylariaceae sp. FL1651]